jgi:hypothetical protein
VPTKNSGSSGAMISLEASVSRLTADSASTFRDGRQDVGGVGGDI